MIYTATLTKQDLYEEEEESSFSAETIEVLVCKIQS